MPGRRPELSQTISAYGRINLPEAEARTRHQMEANQIPRHKGRRTGAAAYLDYSHGAAAVLGLGAGQPAEAPDACSMLSPCLPIYSAPGGIVTDPIGRLLPNLERVTDDEDRPIERVTLAEFVTHILASIGSLTDEEAQALLRQPDFHSGLLELSANPPDATFRWSDGETLHMVLFTYPGPTMDAVLDESEAPPPLQRVTRINFSLLFAIGRLLAPAHAERSETTVPSSGEAPASADPEKGNAAPARAASLGNWSRSICHETRKSDAGKVGGGGENLNPLPPLEMLWSRLPDATSCEGHTVHGVPG